VSLSVDLSPKIHAIELTENSFFSLAVGARWSENLSTTFSTSGSISLTTRRVAHAAVRVIELRVRGNIVARRYCMRQ